MPQRRPARFLLVIAASLLLGAVLAAGQSIVFDPDGSPAASIPGVVDVQSGQYDAGATPPPLDIGGSWLRIGDADGATSQPGGVGIKLADIGASSGTLLYDSSNEEFVLCESSGSNALTCDGGSETLRVDVNAGNVEVPGRLTAGAVFTEYVNGDQRILYNPRNGTLSGYATSPNPGPATGDSRTFVAEDSYADGSTEGLIYRVPFRVPADGGQMFCFLLSNTSDVMSATGEAGYCLYDGYSSNTAYRVYEKYDGSWNMIREVSHPTANDGDWHTATVVVYPSGNTLFSVYIDGDHIDTVTTGQTNYDRRAGYFGLSQQDSGAHVFRRPEVRVGLDTSPLGSFEDCRDILERGAADGNGYYTIDPDGEGGVSPFEVYCDMTTDGGGWTLMTASSGDPPANLFITTSANRDPSSGNVYTDMTIAEGDWYDHIRWGPANARSTNWADVDYPVYNPQSPGTTTWYQCVGQGCPNFSPRISFKCSWSGQYRALSYSNSFYSSNQYPADNWNIPDYSESGNNWEGALPGIRLSDGNTLSDTHNMRGLECNPSDIRDTRIQVWVR